MKAVVYEKQNRPDFLALREVDKPLPREGEVLVKVHAVSLNAADYRSMQLGIVPKSKIYGADIAGVVEAVGAGVQDFAAGDEVVGDISTVFGGLAEYAAAPARLLARKPAGVSFVDAAALPMASVTALQGLRDRGEIRPGQQVLIYGAGGGVGVFAVQLARHFQARVTAVCGAANADLVRSLGAERVLDYAREDALRDAGAYDLILAVNGGRGLLEYRRALAPRGIFVMVGGTLSQVFKTMLFGPLLSLGGKKMRSLAARPDPRDLEFVLSLVQSGQVRPIIDRICPLAETPAAMRYLRQGHVRGKVVIQVTE